ncbi:MAG: flagellar hook-basal body complex protein FliE [Treponema sp.]|nr:flagellar hook-basal body complex protein FliE [Treponema sp.]
MNVSSVSMFHTHQNHMGPLNNSPFTGSGANIINLERTIGAESVTGAGTFQHAMLNALDRVSGAQHSASRLQQEAIINPHLVDVHDITIAQAQARMSLDIAATIMNRVVQGWRDLINTR